jgi:hypothetical protein
LGSQFAVELFLAWVCAEEGQAQSMPQLVFALNQLRGGVERQWGRGDSFKLFVKKLKKLYGRAPETGVEVTVPALHRAIKLANGRGSGVDARDALVLLLLFLGAYRLGEVTGDLRGIRAPN